MILDIYNDSIKYSIKNSKSLLYFGLTLFSTFIIWMAYILILIHYQDANLNLKFASLIVPSLLTLIPIFLFLGYEYRILEISTHGMINGTDKVPEFNNLKEMLINGVKIFLVKFVYFAVPHNNTGCYHYPIFRQHLRRNNPNCRSNNIPDIGNHIIFCKFHKPIKYGCS